MSKKKNFKTRATIFLGVVLFLLLLAAQAHFAQAVDGTAAHNPSNHVSHPEFGLDPSSWLPTILYYITFAIYYVLGIVIAVLTWFIEQILIITFGLVGSTLVKTGFRVTLAIANLGFVLAIIVIAIATIIRSQTYGVKKALWKLIVAAVLVNFSLSIAGAIINLSDNFTLYFINGISSGSISDFASNLGSSFNPHRPGLTAGQQVNQKIDDLGGAFSPSGTTSSDVGSFLRWFAALIFAVLTFIIAVITLAALMVMLFIRYIYLAVLLILMPFAWLAWIFPAFKGRWDGWWHEFIKWTFFAPIVVFFLWLALTIAGNGGLGFQSASTSAGTGVLAAIKTFITSSFNDLITGLLQSIALAGLMLGGLFAANSLSISFAGGALAAATGTAGYIAGRMGQGAGRLGGRAITRPIRGEGGRKLAASLQRAGTGTGIGSKIIKYTGAGYGLRAAGRGLESLGVAGGEKQLTSYGKEFENLTKSQVLNRLPGASLPQRIALLEKAKKEGYMNLNDMPGLEKYIGEGQGAAFNRYGRGKFFEEARHESGVELIRLQNELYDGKITQDAITKYAKGAPNPGLLAETFFQDIQKLKDKASKEGKSFEQVSPAGMSVNRLLEIQETLARGMTHGFSSKNLSSALDKLARGDQLDAFTNAVKMAGIRLGDISEANRRWFETSPAARNLGLGPDIFSNPKASYT